MKRRVAVRGVIVDEEGLLFAVRQNHTEDSVQFDGEWWCSPGGGLDPGEPIQECLSREIQEELGIMPVVGGLLYVQQFIFKDTEHLEFFFHIKNYEDFKKIDLSTTSHGHAELLDFGFVDPKSKVMKPDFLATEDIQKQINSNSPPKFFSYL